jgi:hypothetical protein
VSITTTYSTFFYPSKLNKFFLSRLPTSQLDRVIFVQFLDVEQTTYENQIPKYFPPATDTEWYQDYIQKHNISEPEADDENDSVSSTEESSESQ